MTNPHPHPLSGIRVVELAGLAPVPFASLLLADHGAAILRVDRPHPQAHRMGHPPPPATEDLLTRGKRSIAVNLKSTAGLDLVLSILDHADVLLDPFRPGVLESLGLDPAALHARNKRLIIARLSGFRRSGKYSAMAGHDINYLAVSGVLSQLGSCDARPSPPSNILADFAGGGLACAFGIIMAMLVREQTGLGQVVESAMVDGAAYLGILPRLGLKTTLWQAPRGENLLDGGCPYYGVYKCKDGKFMAVGALETKFFVELLAGLNLDPSLVSTREDRTRWPDLRQCFTESFTRKTRAEWEDIFNGKDACCTPVLTQQELEQEGYEQRHLVQLSITPGVAINQEQAWKSDGLAPGVGGEDMLLEWMGWHRGRNYAVKDGSLFKIAHPNL
ncbi:hypothetical protein N7451_003098 [Penicillium sp. IBT 35674x]|nr:hypothetical protein N7451_003098 [Penicillium sp. IBT 35674x]